MKKISVLLVLVFLIAALSGCGNDQYAKERKIWYIQRQANRIFQNPIATPPGELERVIGLLRSSIRENPDTVISLEQEFVIGRLYTAKEKYVEARDQFNRIITKFKSKPNVASEALFLIGNSYEAEDNWPSALETYRRIMQEYPNTGKGLDVPIHIAKHYEKKHEPEKMIEAYKEAIIYYDSLALKNPGTYFGYIVSNMKAQGYSALKDWESAIGTYNAIIEQYKDKVDTGAALLNIAFIYKQELKDTQKAKEVLQRFIEEYPQSKYLQTATAMLEEVSAN